MNILWEYDCIHSNYCIEKKIQGQSSFTFFQLFLRDHVGFCFIDLIQHLTQAPASA